MVRKDGDMVKGELINSAQAAAWCKPGSHEWQNITINNS